MSDDSTRGDQTRLRLLETATEIFAHNSYDSVRTRMLADAANVNQAAIPYYFGGKKGLYMAVAQRVAADLEAQTRDLRKRTDEILQRSPPAPRDEVVRTLHEVLSEFVLGSLGKPSRSARAGFIIREQQHPTEAFDLIYTQAMEPLHRAITALVARLRERPSEDPDCILHAHALLGQIIGFITAGTTLLRRLGQTQLSTSQVEQIAELVGSLAAAPFTANSPDD